MMSIDWFMQPKRINWSSLLADITMSSNPFSCRKGFVKSGEHFAKITQYGCLDIVIFTECIKIVKQMIKK